ncbi:MAG: phosphate ABC transporter substrate-binding protein PstS [Thermoplasmatota archaeon]
MKSKASLGIVIAALMTGVVFAGCTTSSTPATGNNPGNNTNSTLSLNGVAISGDGSTFAQPLITQWSTDYQPVEGVQLSYQGVGSGQGVKDLVAKKDFFAGSDAPASRVVAGTTGVLHIPETMGGVAITYNVPGVTSLNLTGDILAKIYLGQITTWNDAEIVAANPGPTAKALPAQTIVPVHRSDGSGTTFAFTDYLSHVSSTWKTSPGTATSITWPVAGLAGKGSTGVTNQIQQNQYTIGYVETGYASLNGLPVARIQNAAGVFLAPTLAGVSAAAATATLPTSGSADWSNASIANAPGATSYPISTFTYLVVYQNLSAAYGSSMTPAQAKALTHFLHWAVDPNGGQKDSNNLLFSVLPSAVTQEDDATIMSITYDGHVAYNT